jgi:hypothetical protein
MGLIARAKQINSWRQDFLRRLNLGMIDLSNLSEEDLSYIKNYFPEMLQEIENAKAEQQKLEEEFIRGWDELNAPITLKEIRKEYEENKSSFINVGPLVSLALGTPGNIAVEQDDKTAFIGGDVDCQHFSDGRYYYIDANGNTWPEDIDEYHSKLINGIRSGGSMATSSLTTKEMKKGFKIFKETNIFDVKSPPKLLGQTQHFSLVTESGDGTNLVSGAVDAYLFSDGKYYVVDKENNIWPHSTADRYKSIVNQHDKDREEEENEFYERCEIEDLRRERERIAYYLRSTLGYGRRLSEYQWDFIQETLTKEGIEDLATYLKELKGPKFDEHQFKKELIMLKGAFNWMNPHNEDDVRYFKRYVNYHDFVSKCRTNYYTPSKSVTINSVRTFELLVEPDDDTKLVTGKVEEFALCDGERHINGERYIRDKEGNIWPENITDKQLQAINEYRANN